VADWHIKIKSAFLRSRFTDCQIAIVHRYLTRADTGVVAGSVVFNWSATQADGLRDGGHSRRVGTDGTSGLWMPQIGESHGRPAVSTLIPYTTAGGTTRLGQSPAAGVLKVFRYPHTRSLLQAKQREPDGGLVRRA
jgi:hypothetical protein